MNNRFTSLMTNIRFGAAMSFIQDRPYAYVARREGWNGKNMFVFFTPGNEFPNNKNRSFIFFEDDVIETAGHFDMRAADGKYVSGWLASQTDMAAQDWEVLVLNEVVNG